MCGVVGVRLIGSHANSSLPSAGEYALNLLLKLQHRGQDGAGLSVLNEAGTFETVRGLGLIDVALKDWATLPPSMVAVAHTRYATTGTGGVGEIQPFVRGAPKVALAHNGNIVNVADLTERFQLQLETASDLDVLQQIFLKKSAEGGFVHAVQTIFDEFNGSYAVVGVETSGALFGFRDPFGIRPLFMARSPDLVALASETSALNVLPDCKVEEIQPGEWVRVDAEGRVERGRLVAKRNPESKERFCMFEIVYFSSPQAEIKSDSVYRLRFRLGQELAHEIFKQLPVGHLPRTEFDFVVPVPDTSRTAAIAVAESLGVPYREFLVKNNYVTRTFILGRQDQRLKALNQKLSLIGPEIKGKRVLLVDDSVVRGNTSRLMALRLREAGAESVSLASTCPPITNGCFYGIDFPDSAELVAHGRDVPAIAKSLGVNGLYYISVEGLKSALRTANLCMACLDGDYPTRDASFERFLERRREERLG